MICGESLDPEKYALEDVQRPESAQMESLSSWGRHSHSTRFTAVKNE